MNANPVKLRSTDTVGTAIQYILSHHLRHVPVVDADNRYLGVFGIYSALQLTLPKAVTMDRGLQDVSFVTADLKELSERLREREKEPVVNSLRQDIPVVDPDTSLAETILLLLRTRIALPVVEKTSGRLVGMVSSWGALENIVQAKGGV